MEETEKKYYPSTVLSKITLAPTRHDVQSIYHDLTNDDDQRRASKCPCRRGKRCRDQAAVNIVQSILSNRRVWGISTTTTEAVSNVSKLYRDSANRPNSSPTSCRTPPTALTYQNNPTAGVSRHSHIRQSRAVLYPIQDRSRIRAQLAALYRAPAVHHQSTRRSLGLEAAASHAPKYSGVHNNPGARFGTACCRIPHHSGQCCCYG